MQEQGVVGWVWEWVAPVELPYEGACQRLWGPLQEMASECSAAALLLACKVYATDQAAASSQ